MTANRLKKLETAINFGSDKSNFDSGISGLKILAKFLSDLLEVDYVLIDKYSTDKPQLAESIVFHTPSGLLENIVYNLKDTPCQKVIGADLCSYNFNVQEHFPKDELLSKMEVKSYIGIPLWAANRTPIGLMAVLHKEKLTDIVTVELVLKAIASFAGRLLERVIYESKLKISEDRFNLLLQSSEDMITIHEPSGKYLYYNGPSRYPFTPKDVVGKMPIDFFDKDTSEKIQSTFDKVTNTGNGETIELVFQSLGLERWFSNYIYPVKNINGEVVELVKVSRDIHDQKIGEQEIERQNEALLKSEKELQESNEEYQTLNEELRKTNEELINAKEQIADSEAKFRTIFNHSTDAIVVAKRGLGVYFNPAYLKLLGYPNEDALKGKRITEQIAVSEREKVTQFIKERSLGHLAPVVYESRGLRKSGEEFDYEIAVSSYTLANETYTLGIIRDITERKAIQKELDLQNEKLKELNQALNEAQKLSHVGNWKLITETNEVTWSKELFNIFELPPELGAPDYTKHKSYYTEQSFEIMNQGVTNLLEHGTPYDVELEIYTSSGSIRHITSRGQTLRDKSNRIIGCYGTAQDITERKLIQKELEDQAEKLNDLNNALNRAQELSHVGSWVNDLENQSIEWSAETFRIWGFNPKEGAPDFETLFSRIHPDDKELILRSVDQAVNQGKPYDIEHRICLPNGEEKILRAIGQLVHGDHGQVIRLTGITQDITERKLAEENFRINEYRLALAIQANDQGVWDVDLKANTIFLTKRCKEMFGYAEEEIGNDLDVWTKLVHPEDLPSLLEARNSVINGEAQSFSNEHRKLCKNGSWKWVQVRGVVATRDKNGQILRITGTYADISSKKQQQEQIIQSEKRLNEAQTTAKIGSWEFNINTFKLTWSREHYRIFELEEDILPEKLYEAYRSKIHPDDIPELDRVINLAIGEGRGYEYEHRVICKYGRIKYILGIGQPELDAHGKVVGIKGTAQDITQRKLFQQELDIQNKKLNELNRTLNQAQKLSQVGSWQWDMTSDKAEWSDEMYNIYGVTKGDFYPSNENVRKTVLREDLQKVEIGVGSLLKGEIFSPFEFRIMRPSGEIRNLYIVALEKGGDGTENEEIIFGVTQDITERKEREKTSHHLAQIASNSTDMIYLINSSYQYLAANHSYLTAFGLTDNQLLSENLSDIMGEAYFKNVIIPNVKKCLDGENVHYQTWYNFPKTGKKYMDIKYTKYLDHEGVLSGVAINSRDISFRKHAEDKVTRSLEEKELLLRELYHRTKNNMQVISSMLSIQSIYSENEEVKVMLDETKNRIMGMALVHEKLYQANDLSWIDLKDYITDLVELLKVSLLSKTSNLDIVMQLENTRTNIDTAIPCGLIINELFTNAIKHGFPQREKGIITISLFNSDENEICIAVKDDGKGIPEGFDIRNSNSYGLTAVIMLSEHQLGGSLTLDSTNGTEFILKFKEIVNADRV